MTWDKDTIIKKSTPPPYKPEQLQSLSKRTPEPKQQPHKETKMAKSAKNSNGIGSIPMHHKKDTAGTYVYESDDPDAAIPTIYIKKAGMPNGKLDKIIVTVTGG